jgi:two-component system, NarL family, sensor kinase
VAIVRERLYDIDLLISRSLVYATLTAGVVAVYVAVVTVVGTVVGDRAEFAGPLVATGIVAVAFQPAREAVQRQVSRLVHGAAADPYAALARLAQRLEATIGPGPVLSVVVETVATTLRMPYVAIELAEDGSFRRVASHGEPGPAMTPLLLTHQGQTIGRMVLGERTSGEALTPTERRLLGDLVRQAGIAVHGVRLTAVLQRSRERLVVTREEERRRLHRDLHDGLGPTLAAMTLQLDVLRRQITTDPSEADALVRQLKDELQSAIHEIRRLVDALRPPALDELGLVAALRQHAIAVGAEGGAATGLTVTVEARDLPPLDAATEVAAYRIAMEAMTNVVRHARARQCTIRLASNGALEVEVIDDGDGIPDEPRPGVGLTSMRERALELGGHCSISLTPGGGTTVRARLPLEVR